MSQSLACDWEARDNAFWKVPPPRSQYIARHAHRPHIHGGQSVLSGNGSIYLQAIEVSRFQKCFNTKVHIVSNSYYSHHQNNRHTLTKELVYRWEQGHREKDYIHLSYFVRKETCVGGVWFDSNESNPPLQPVSDHLMLPWQVDFILKNRTHD